MSVATMNTKNSKKKKKNKESVGARSDAQQVSYCKERVLAFI